MTLTDVPDTDAGDGEYTIGHSIEFLSGSSGNYNISYSNYVFTILPYD